MLQNLLNAVYNSISAESSMYKGGNNGVENKWYRNEKKLVDLIIFISICKSKWICSHIYGTKNMEGCPSKNDVMKVFKSVMHFDDTWARRTSFPHS